MDPSVDSALQVVLYDPQTSGGLLIAASQNAAGLVAGALAAAGVLGARIGRVEALRPGIRIVVRP